MNSPYLIPEDELHQYYKNICHTRQVSFEEFKKNYFQRRWIKQPPKSYCCGSIAVAIVAGITLEEAIKLTGKKGSTSTKNIAKALRELGYKCPDRCKKMPRPLLGIGQLHKPKKSGWHWVVVDGDKIYDGINGNPDGTVNWEKGWRITSYLPITKI